MYLLNNILFVFITNWAFLQPQSNNTELKWCECMNSTWPKASENKSYFYEDKVGRVKTSLSEQGGGRSPGIRSACKRGLQSPPTPPALLRSSPLSLGCHPLPSGGRTGVPLVPPKSVGWAAVISHCQRKEQKSGEFLGSMSQHIPFSGSCPGTS